MQFHQFFAVNATFLFRLSSNPQQLTDKFCFNSRFPGKDPDLFLVVEWLLQVIPVPEEFMKIYDLLFGQVCMILAPVIQLSNRADKIQGSITQGLNDWHWALLSPRTEDHINQ